MDQGKTIANLSSAKRVVLEQRLKGAMQGEPEHTIHRVPRSGPLPASFAQQRLWFFDQLSPGNPMYNVYEAFRLRGLLDVPALEQSLREIVRRHESLRTVFDCLQGRPVQIIQENVPFTLNNIDLRTESPRPSGWEKGPGEGNSTPNLEPELLRLLGEEATRPFDLSRDLMLRATLYRLNEEEHVLFIAMHHIASDGWSLHLFFHELTTLYDAFRLDQGRAGCPQHAALPRSADFQSAVSQASSLQNAPSPDTRSLPAPAFGVRQPSAALDSPLSPTASPQTSSLPLLPSVNLPELPIQYADYAVWQRHALESGQMEPQLAFWRKQLAGAPVGLEFPTDHPRPPVQTFRGGAESISISPALTAALKALSRKEGVTFYMLLLAAFKALVHRYSRQSDIVIGTPIAGRNQLQTENLIGFFINTLVLRTDLSNNPTFRELLGRVRQTTLDAFTNQDVPFDKLVIELQPERSSTHSPFFQILFASQNTSAQPMALAGLTVTRMAIPNGTAKFDLTMMANDNGSDMTFDVEYNRDLFEAGTVARMLGHFKTLLEGIAADPAQRLSELPLLTPRERTQLLVEWNATDREFPHDKTVVQLFEEQAARSPDAIAIVTVGRAVPAEPPICHLPSAICHSFEAAPSTLNPQPSTNWRAVPAEPRLTPSAPNLRRLNYVELNTRASQLAHALQAQGVAPGTCVGIYLERGPELIISMLAVLKAGAAYLPLDRAYPKERLAFMLADAKAALVITKHDLVQNLTPTEPSTINPQPPTTSQPSTLQVLCLDTDAEFINGQSQLNPVSAATAESLAYVIYTSGSTGQPKGACIPHRAINRLLINTDYIRLDASDVVAQAANCSFDAATFEVWGALLHGAKLVIFENDLLLSPADFARQLQAQGVTAMFLTTALFNIMARENPSAFKHLSTLLVGGEALDPRWIAAVLRADPPAHLFNIYGPTETTTFAVSCQIKAVPDPSRSIPIGRPIANTTLYILDEQMQPVPIGVPGELYIGGPGVAYGYLNRPGLTREKFVPNPFAVGTRSTTSHYSPSDSAPVGTRSTASHYSNLPLDPSDGERAAVRGPAYDRLYKTGDLVRYRPDGKVEFLGRLDSQVKIRGFRIELGEIETVLGQHAAVRQCAIVVTEEKAGPAPLGTPSVSQKILTAFVSAAENFKSTPKPELAAALRAHLTSKLPEYMVPSEFVVLPLLPINANGKVDRRALAALKPAEVEGSGTTRTNTQVPPRDELETQLVHIWEEVLRRHPIGITDQFFQLGGHSLLAVELAVRIEKVLDRRISVSRIFQSPTIEQLAAVLRRAETGEPASATGAIVEIQGQGSNPPLFLVHGVGGGMFWGYQNLSRHLGQDQPVYVIKSRGMDGQEEFVTVEEMAAHYVAELRAFKPSGPYYLGGYCFGGNVAYEMARQLIAQGQSIGILALMNCAPPHSSYGRIRWTPRFAFRFLANLLVLLRNSTQWSATQRNDFLRWKARIFFKSLRDLSLTHRPSPAEMEVERFVDLSTYSEEQRKLWETHIEALLRFHPGTYAGPITLFRARAHPFLCSFDPLCGWGDLAAGGVSLKLVTGPHEGILDEPHVQQVARELALCLQVAQGKGKGAQPEDNGGHGPLPELVPAEKRAPSRADLLSKAGLLLVLLAGIVGLVRTQALNRQHGFSASQWEYPPVAALAAAGFVGRPGSRRRTEKPIPKAPAAEFWPLSFAQERLFFLAQLDPLNPAYQLSRAIRMRGPLNVGALEKSLEAIVRQQTALRMIFSLKDGQAVQSVSPQTKVSLPEIDLRSIPSGEREEVLQKRMAEEARRPFDLSRDLLVRTVLLRLAEEEAVLQATFHQIAADEASMGIFMEGLVQANADSPPLPVQYYDYAVWQREQLKGEDELLEFWKTRLEGAPSVLELPADGPRPVVQSPQGARQPIQISRAVMESLRSVGTQENATLYIILLAGFQTLLVRYSGREDLLIGSLMDNRKQPEIERVIGCFKNILVMRAEASGDPTFKELLGRTRDWVNEAVAHDELPFENLLQEMHLGRDRSIHPLVQVMFALEKPPAEQEDGRLRWEVVEVDTGTTKCDLTLRLRETEEGLTGWFEYANDLFNPGRMARMARNFETLLEGIAAAPSRRLSELELLSEPERRLVVEEWNRTERAYPADRSIVRLFEEQVALQPEAEALVFNEQRLSYGELNRRADQLAQELRMLGVGRDVPVSICLERKPEVVIAILGVLKAGGVYVPMDPSYPSERLAFMLQDSGASTLVTEQKVLDRVPLNASDIICLDREQAQRGEAKGEQAVPAPNDLAYILYTSGSTGQPKGVAVEHRSVTAFLHWAREVYSPEELAGVLFVTSPCFDVSVFEMFVPLAWGGKIILADNPLAWTHLPAAGEVTLVSTVPSLVAEWLRAGGLPESLRTVNMAGEPVPQRVVDQIYEQCPNVKRVYDLYGPTEATVYSTFAWRKAGQRPTIGRPLSNEQVYLLDAHRQPVPIGVPGELHIGGAGLARGYWGQPRLTMEKFVPNPFRPGERLYKTGDLARYYEDGNLEYLGRFDQQVKIRGHRIELGEVETHLRLHPSVADVVVTVRENEPGNKGLVAYVAPKDGEADVSAWRNFVKQKLPEFMVPSRFVVLQALPRTPNGKVDRKALPAPDRDEVERDYVAPQTQAEVLLAGIWGEVLGRGKIGVHQNFFELGGHSLMIMQVLARIRDSIDVELPMRVLFDAPTVSALAQVIEETLVKEIGELTEEEAQQLENGDAVENIPTK